MAETGDSDILDVLVGDMESAVDESADFTGEDECLSATRRNPTADIAVCWAVGSTGGGIGFGVRREDESCGVLLDMGRDDDGLDEGLHFEDAVAVDDRVSGWVLSAGGAIDDFHQVFESGVSDINFEQEAIELRFGERVGSFLLDWVLGREDKEGFVELVGFSGDSDGVLLHRFEERGLGLWSGAVDLVSEEDLSEDRTLLELEGSASCFCIFGDNVGPDDISRHEVWGELDAIEREREGCCECADEEGFSESGYAFKQDVTAAEEADEDGVDDLLLSDHDFADLGAEL